MSGELLEAYYKLGDLFPRVPRPALNLNCERSCPEVDRCTSLGCYKNGVINLRTGAGVDVLIHEYGHHLFHKVVGDHIDPSTCERFAWALENSLRDRVLCERCGHTIVHDWKEGLCLYCGETYVREERSSELLGSIGKGLLMGAVAGLLGGLVVGLIPSPREEERAKLQMISKLVGLIAATSLVSIIGYSI